VYLTDGDAEFPPKPRYPVVWVLPASSSVTPPWGETVRLK
jgi:predicted metal-dependent peptidase